jgi:GDP-L-fucose synthase
MDSSDRSQPIFVAGHRGMVGSAILRRLQNAGYSEVICRTRAELDLTDSRAVHDFFEKTRISQVYLAAAKVGGIHANDTFPADFIFENLMMQCNVISAAHKAGVQRLLFLGSSCIYPRLAAQPMAEEALLSGPLEPTNEPYAVAKIAGIKMCESYNRQFGTDFRSVMPTNLYGPNDNFHPTNSHVVPGLIGRFHAAKLQNAPEVVVWGTGAPMRELLHVDDMAEACLHVMNLSPAVWIRHIDPRLSHINVGSGVDYSIREIAEEIARAVGFTGKIVFDPTKPNGAPRKLLNVAKINELGWKASIPLRAGLRNAYEWFLQNHPQPTAAAGVYS